MEFPLFLTNKLWDCLFEKIEPIAITEFSNYTCGKSILVKWYFTLLLNCFTLLL